MLTLNNFSQVATTLTTLKKPKSTYFDKLSTPLDKLGQALIELVTLVQNNIWIPAGIMLLCAVLAIGFGGQKGRESGKMWIMWTAVGVGGVVCVFTLVSVLIGLFAEPNSSIMQNIPK